MKSLITLAGCLLMGATGMAQATSIDIQVTPWLAPNSYGSPSFAGAVANEEYALLNGLSAYGTPGTPTYFQARSDVTSAEAVVTGFPSWMGRADPGSVFGPAFANELGNRMHFGLLALGNGMQFSASDLSFVMTSTDPYNALDYAFPGGSYTYSSELVGILYGADGVLGGGDDTFITSGPSTQLVDALVGRGSGNSFAAYCSGCTIAQQQAAIDGVAAYPGSPFDFTGTYTIATTSGTFDGSGTFHVSTVPEPATLPLIGVGLLGMVVWSRKRRCSRADELLNAAA